MFLLFLLTLKAASMDKKLIRLQNIESVCYANSLFQCLNNCEELGFYFRYNEFQFRDRKDVKLYEIFMKLEHGQSRLLNLNEEYKSLKEILNDENLTRSTTFDPAEFLWLLLSKGDTKAEMMQPKSPFCLEIRKDMFSDLFILSGTKGLDYFFHISDKPSLSTNLEVCTDNFGRIKRYPKIFVILYQEVFDYTNNLEYFSIRDREYRLSAFIVYTNINHYYAVIRRHNKLIMINDDKISPFISLNSSDRMYMGFYERD